HTTLFDHLAFGSPDSSQVLAVTDALGHMTSYRYDVTGGLMQVSGPNTGLQRTWTINLKGLPDSDTQPESGTTTSTYDAVGNLSSVTDANNQTANFTYDANNRLTFRDAPDTVDDLTIVYDAAGRVAMLKAGNPSAPAATTTFAYDVPNRNLTRTDSPTAATFVSISPTDANDNLDTITYPSGRLVTYHHDAENKLTSFDHRPPGAGSSTPFAQAFSYGDDGRLSTYVTGAVTHRFSYEAGRPKR